MPRADPPIARLERPPRDVRALVVAPVVRVAAAPRVDAPRDVVPREDAPLPLVRRLCAPPRAVEVRVADVRERPPPRAAEVERPPVERVDRVPRVLDAAPRAERPPVLRPPVERLDDERDLVEDERPPRPPDERPRERPPVDRDERVDLAMSTPFEGFSRGAWAGGRDTPAPPL